MLPSGNDAALVLSEGIGLMKWFIQKNKTFHPHQKGWYEHFYETSNKNFSYLFINLINEKCKQIGLQETHIYNSHGNDAFDQYKNISTCNEIGKISS